MREFYCYSFQNRTLENITDQIPEGKILNEFISQYFLDHPNRKFDKYRFIHEINNGKDILDVCFFSILDGDWSEFIDRLSPILTELWKENNLDIKNSALNLYNTVCMLSNFYKKECLNARIIKTYKNMETEWGFSIEVLGVDTKEWGLDTYYPVSNPCDTKKHDQMLISIDILGKICDLFQYGYRIFCGEDKYHFHCDGENKLSRVLFHSDDCNDSYHIIIETWNVFSKTWNVDVCWACPDGYDFEFLLGKLPPSIQDKIYTLLANKEDVQYICDEREARIVYQEKTDTQDELYILEIWDKGLGLWIPRLSCPCLNSRNYPDAENGFISLTFIQNIINLIHSGYQIRYIVSEE